MLKTLQQRYDFKKKFNFNYIVGIEMFGTGTDVAFLNLIKWKGRIWILSYGAIALLIAFKNFIVHEAEDVSIWPVL